MTPWTEELAHIMKESTDYRLMVSPVPYSASDYAQSQYVLLYCSVLTSLPWLLIVDYVGKDQQACRDPSPPNLLNILQVSVVEVLLCKPFQKIKHSRYQLFRLHGLSEICYVVFRIVKSSLL